MHKFLFYNKFIIFLYMFRALSAHHQTYYKKEFVYYVRQLLRLY